MSFGNVSIVINHTYKKIALEMVNIVLLILITNIKEVKILYLKMYVRFAFLIAQNYKTILLCGLSISKECMRHATLISMKIVVN